MALSLIGELLFKLAIFITIGYVLRKKNLINDDFQNRLGNVILSIVLPSAIIASGNEKKTGLQQSDFLWCLLIVSVYYIVSLLIFSRIAKFLPLDLQRQKLFTNLVVFSNVGMIGFPITQQLYGSQGLLIAVLYNLVFYIFMYSIGIGRLRKQKVTLKKYLITPINIALIITMILFFSPIELPTFISSTLKQLGDMSGPLSMFVVGSTLAKIPFRDVINSKWSYLITVLRQFILPLLMAIILWFLGFRGVMPAVCVLLTATPTATMNLILAEQYGHDVSFATKATVHGNIMMLLTLPLILLLLSILFF